MGLPIRTHLSLLPLCVLFCGGAVCITHTHTPCLLAELDATEREEDVLGDWVLLQEADLQ